MVEPTIKAKLELVSGGGALGTGNTGGVFSKAEERSFRLEQLKSARNAGSLLRFFVGGKYTAALIAALAGITIVSKFMTPSAEEQEIIDDTDAVSDVGEAIDAIKKGGEGIKDIVEGALEYDKDGTIKENSEALSKSFGGIEKATEAGNESLKGFSEYFDSIGMPTVSGFFDVMLNTGAKFELWSKDIKDFVDVFVESSKKIQEGNFPPAGGGGASIYVPPPGSSNNSSVNKEILYTPLFDPDEVLMTYANMSPQTVNS